MSVGVPREVKPGENRVALTPHGVEALKGEGADVRVQTGAGEESGFPDAEYAAAGARVVPTAADAWETDLVVKVKEPIRQEYPFLSVKSALFTYLHLAALPELTDALLESRVTGIAYETVSDGGRLPLLRPMSEVAGILAVQVGARALEKACGGRGVLLSGVGGAGPPPGAGSGAGTAGREAGRAAAGVGADVAILDISAGNLERAAREIPGRVRTVSSTPEAIASEVEEADLV